MSPPNFHSIKYLKQLLLATSLVALTACGGGGGGASLGSETSSAVTISGATTTSIEFTKSDKIAVLDIELSTTAAADVTSGKVTVKETTVGSETSSKIVKGSSD